MASDKLRVEILKCATYLLLKLGFHAQQKGYRYLREAILIVYQDREASSSITKFLYPEIAKRYMSSDKQVERAIRNSIETAWEKGNIEEQRVVFASICRENGVRPTNTEVVNCLVDYIQGMLVNDVYMFK